eukprot:CAMPEP_0172699266 /NCGR_PEP_ID=MMETSP1074-20121228/30060_1 /TAXON_ID=2916 /ORGANISM="Ceratium fusus, Strain PA161109" /LENGTH=72 /DNA_ID=CAMNT_0013520443 /DNA_START=26 /DNA_END=244 /DNA_ORIENTATION=-
MPHTTPTPPDRVHVVSDARGADFAWMSDGRRLLWSVDGFMPKVARTLTKAAGTTANATMPASSNATWVRLGL